METTIEHTEQPRRLRRFVYVTAIALGLAVGATAVAAAATYRTTREDEAADGPEDEARDAADELAYTAAHLDEVAIDARQAEAAAVAVKPGRVFDTHLQTEDGRMTWEVKTDNGSTVWEIQIDPQTGTVVSVQPDE